MSERGYYCPYCGRETGIMGHGDQRMCDQARHGGKPKYAGPVFIGHEIEAARKEEREACAKIADAVLEENKESDTTCANSAVAARVIGERIRERKTE